ncbi:Hsp20/alpha crystallin family protein [Pseudophaeobacter sp.]|uniref:Hsp20/alpha crystallin family protein n=1 Tax=Pseudophaeobacter sp. TaxID=1971739 RepID=UPI004059D234
MVEKSETGGFWPSLYDPFRSFGSRMADWLNPAAEASSGKETYDIAMELPGVAQEDVELTVDADVLTVRGEKRTQSEKKGDTWYFSERQYGAFRRSFRLPENADGQSASARMVEGVLHISVPKKAPDTPESARRIEIGTD